MASNTNAIIVATDQKVSIGDELTMDDVIVTHQVALGVEFLVCGFDHGNATLFTVGERGVVKYYGDIGFWLSALEANAAGMASSKKNQTCAPRPERERSRAVGRFSRRHVSRNAVASSCHPALSKSTARKKHVSSRNSG
jgi:hypothetical protein